MTSDPSTPISVLLVGRDRSSTDRTVATLEGGDEPLAVTTATGLADVRRLLEDGRFDCVAATADPSDPAERDVAAAIADAGRDCPLVVRRRPTDGGAVPEQTSVDDGAGEILRAGPTVDDLRSCIVDAVETRRRERTRKRTRRVDEMIRGVTADLVRASTTEAVERAVCSAIDESAAYALGWIGHVHVDENSEERVIRPTAATDADARPSRPVTVAGGETAVCGSSAETVTVHRFDADADTDDSQRWKPRESGRSVDAVAVVELDGAERCRRVVAVYASEPFAFGESEVDALAAFGETVGAAFDAVTPHATGPDASTTVDRERFESVFESIPYPTAHVELEDGCNRVKAVNSAFSETFGYTESAAVGRSINDLIVRPERTEAAQRLDRRVADGEHVEAELRRETVDGPRRFLFRARKFDVHDGSREALGVYVDITERKRREAELERYERIIEAAGDPVYTLDPEGYFTYVNAQIGELTNQPPDDLVGKHVSSMMPEEEVRRGTDLIEELLDDPDRDRATVQMSVRRDGEEVPVENHIALLPSEDGFAGTVGVLRDISARVEREERLKAQNERLEAFSSIVGHDLRNPLNVAQGHLDLVRAADAGDGGDDGDGVDRTETLDTVARALDRMERLIETLLTLAREGRSVSELEPVALDDLVCDCRDTAETMGGTLEVEASETILADPTRLRQLVENLVRNAIEHGGPDVTVRVSDVPGGFAVEDDGPGIPPEERDDVFEVGYTSGDGTGLGLSIVKRIAEAHEWDVAVETSEDGGARFTVTGVERSA